MPEPSVLDVSGLVEDFVVVDAEHSQPVVTEQNGAAPIPLTCGSKKRAATWDITINADKP
jgi:hypothetical protein